MTATGIASTLEKSAVPLRDPDEIMTLACMGSAHQHRFSFMRVLLRRLKREKWTFTRPVWVLDENGYGTAVYTARGPTHSYSLIAFSHYLDPAMRSDRVIATAWDATFTLFDGVPSTEDIERLRGNVPKQEAGRVSNRELSVSRANKSVRLFDHVVDRLASGLQPDEASVAEVGYLMRTTAVYGSGKLGAADYDSIADRPEFSAPYQAEMLSVYLTREFTLDLVDHIAKARAPEKAAPLTPKSRRTFGIGNSTGLGMAPYLVNHPLLLNSWVRVRETALARIRSLPLANASDLASFSKFLQRAMAGVALWRTDDAIQTERTGRLAADLKQVAPYLSTLSPQTPNLWDQIYRWVSQKLSLEARELIVSLLIEMYPEITDGLESLYRVDEADCFHIDGSRLVGDVRAALAQCYKWVHTFDFTDRKQTARFWYTSEEKLEPRLGERWEEEGSAREHPLGVAREMQALDQALSGWRDDDTLAAFLLSHPEHRHSVRRLTIARSHPYSEIRDNVIDAAMRPIDVLRFKLAFFGATRFDPRSDRWVRITMFQNAPGIGELARVDADDWVYPLLPAH